ncbi:hypothetical protein OSB04_002522 [Centaurea solstitialis]|uniref:Integrase catalytic domain-containing protein n=1 Tax=Centaurea solstitialis TaxID=347529 RepID=A0AA38WVC7_9ASTR|nr:hypothetical protein OSB04_002522 [Centaurea solstitialis]
MIKGYGMIVKGEVRMNQVSYVDGRKHNLISVSQLCDNGLDVLFKIKYCIMYRADTLIEVMRASRRGDLYLMCFETLEAKEEICLVSSMKNEDAWLWHTRFCHLNLHTLDKLVRLKLVKGLPNIKYEKDHLCSACEMGKLRRSSHKTKLDPSYDKPLQMLHVDLCGPIVVHSFGGRKYILIKVLRSDNGTEFKNAVVEEYLASVGITHNFSAPRTPQQNGVVERKNRTLVEATRTMLNASRLPLAFWAKVVSAACYTQNRSLIINIFEKPPYHLLHNKRPNVKFVHVFGCKCYVLNDREPIGKFNTKGDDAIFLGYSWDSAAYRVYVPRSGIVVVKDLEQLFHGWYEDDPDPERISVTDARASADDARDSEENLQNTETSPQSVIISGPSASNTPPSIPKASPTQFVITYEQPSQEDCPVIPEPTLSPHSLEEITSSVHPPHTTRWTKDHPLSQVIGNISEGVNIRATANYCLFSCFVSQTKPKNISVALIDPFWVEAMQDKLTQLDRNQVWTLVPLPNGKMAIGTKWVFRNKKDEQGVVVRNKARLVAQEYCQEEGIDYEETFAPVYVKQPPGFESAKYPNHVYFLDKALYGLKQAPRAWYERLSTFLTSNSFHRGTTDINLFYKRHDDDILLVQVYVDDIVFGSTDVSMCKDFESLMQKEFEVSMMGELTFFLGLQVKQSLEGIFINQCKYANDLLKKYKLHDAFPMRTPMAPNLKLHKNLSGQFVECKLYRGMIGSLLYLTTSRPDIMFSTCICARYQANPKESHLSVVKRILRYLKKTPSLGLWYPPNAPIDLVAYTDSDYGGCQVDRKSNSGSCQFLGGKLVSWSSKKQNCVSTSTTEAEYVVAASCCSQALWMQTQLSDYGYSLDKIPFFVTPKVLLPSLPTLFSTPKLSTLT